MKAMEGPTATGQILADRADAGNFARTPSFWADSLLYGQTGLLGKAFSDAKTSLGLLSVVEGDKVEVRSCSLWPPVDYAIFREATTSTKGSLSRAAPHGPLNSGTERVPSGGVMDTEVVRSMAPNVFRQYGGHGTAISSQGAMSLGGAFLFN